MSYEHPLARQRFCPRCNERTVWRPGLDGVDDGTLYCNNVRDGEPEPCGLTVTTELSDAEAERLAAFARETPRTRTAADHRPRLSYRYV